MTVINYPVPYVPQDGRTYSYRAPVPIRYACPQLPPNYVLNDNDRWNCNLCGSASEFYAPFERGDIIPFQTRLPDNYNMPNDVLNAGIRSLLTPANYYVEIELLDGDGVLISNIADDFCEVYFVGYSPQYGSIQQWHINTGKFPTDLKCFRLRINYYKIDQATALPVLERTIYTQDYREVTDCRNTVLIESVYQTVDCNGNVYVPITNYLGNMNTPFYNSMRLWGEVQLVDETESVERNDRDVIISQTITENYKIISSVYPEYFVRRLSQTVRGRTVNIDGIVYENFQFNEKPDEIRMYPIDLTFDKICRLDNRKCDFTT